ncbi:hypothetical protein BJ965_001040 [Streptomyces luteogriseus]|uniref:Uncharacterized protein n=1 Tax=Streptomyces luteogriseus TaxID=68233 RepID=A0A7W7DHY6_9ACTN|nr:hypothetical protein [Streptomyces luteogriseus]MBB4711158.1 hypothetical protein [Streptomyces luteogriseus]
MNGISEQDIAAAREQGDLAALVLMSSGLTIKAPKPRTAPRVLSTPRARPGAWPDGTRSPGLTPEVAEHLAQLWPGRFSPGAAIANDRPHR